VRLDEAFHRTLVLKPALVSGHQSSFRVLRRSRSVPLGLQQARRTHVFQNESQ
jgi:hypothetical protein